MTKQSEEIISIIRKIGLIVAEKTEQRTVLNSIAKTLAIYANAELCSIYLYDNNHNALILTASNKDVKEHTANKKCILTNEGIIGKTFLTRKISSSLKRLSDPLKRINLCTLTVPLLIADEAVGVLILENKQLTSFSKIITKLLKEVSPQIANVLLDYRMFSLMQKDGRSLKISSENSQLLGQSVSSGVALGCACIMDNVALLDSIIWKRCKNIDDELKLFDEALEYAKNETIRLEKEASLILTESNAAIFYSHLLIIEDKQLLDSVRALIQEGSIVQFALKTTLMQLKNTFEKIDNEGIRERLSDITDVILRIIYSVTHILQGKAAHPSSFFRHNHEDEKIIMIAHELYPSQLISWPLHKLAGIICETGGATSHVAIIAKALKIPTLMSVKNATKEIKERDKILLDCTSNTCYINPGRYLLNSYKEIFSEQKEKRTKKLSCEEDIQFTADNIKIDLLANISLVNEIPLIKQFGAGGIGLYRSEFVFMMRTSQPTIEEQHQIFSKFAQAIKGRPFTLRLLDIGGDKPVSYLSMESETNPLLGMRGLRFLLNNPRLFKAHLEAILLTSLETEVRILIPMVTTVDELLITKSIIEQVRLKLEHRMNREFKNYKIGIMVETPAIIWELGKIAKLVDFFSIGSNDLVQYSYAADRNNSSSYSTFYAANPATIKMLRYVVIALEKYPEKTLTVCGEIGSDPRILPLLIGIGYRKFSMSPWLIPKIRKILKNISVKDCEKLAQRYMHLEVQEEANNMINKFLERHSINIPENEN